MAETTVFKGRGYNARTLPGFAAIAIFAFVVIYAPIIILVVYSFNAGTSLAIWEGFSLRWYAQAAANEQVQSAALRSLYLAGMAATIATVAATMAALATTRTTPQPQQGGAYLAWVGVGWGA